MRPVFRTMKRPRDRWSPTIEALILAVFLVALFVALATAVRAQPSSGAPAAAAVSAAPATMLRPPTPAIPAGPPSPAVPAGPREAAAPGQPGVSKSVDTAVPAVSGRAEDPSAAASPQATAPAATLPQDLSFTGMFLNASPVVQSVIVGLLAASIVTWTVWLAKTLELAAGRRRLRGALVKLTAAKSLADVASTGDRVVDALLREAHSELGQSAGLPEGRVSERVAARLERVQATAARRALAGTSILATIGSSAPFVGLFGTVWGIMTSFIGISQAQTTNLMVVAPGIAEALLATAFGLIAAIPAGIIYNAFARMIAGHRGLFSDAATLVLCLTGRDLDRRAVTTAS